MKRPAKQTKRTTVILLALIALVLFSAARAEASLPSSAKITFESDRTGNEEIFVMNADGTNPVNVSNNPAADNNPSWSPDGKRIAFNSQRDGDTEIYVMNADGSNPIRLTFTPGTDGDPTWAPDGSKIAFQSQRDGAFEIYSMNADGSNQTRLTFGASGVHPHWSPDGKKILFDSIQGGTQRGFLLELATGIINVLGDGEGQVATFSPDGTRIVLQHRFGSNNQVALLNPDGTNLVQLTFVGFNSSPSFTADGKKIIFTSTRDGDLEVFTMNANGSAQTQLTNNTVTDNVPASQPVFRHSTIGVFRPATAQFLLRNSNSDGGPNAIIAFGQANDLPVAGDWGGDGKTDVGVFRNGQFQLRQPTILNILGHQTTVIVTLIVNFGQAGDLPVAGDWDGNGTDTPGVFRPSTGQWLLTNSTSANPPVNITFNFGQAGDKPLAGDWNGDGIDTVGLYRSSISSFILSNTFNGTIDVPIFLFGSLGSVAFTGDWNADGTDNAGVFNNNIGVMGLNFTNTTGNGVGDLSFSFGQNGDIPLAGDWDGQP